MFSSFQCFLLVFGYPRRKFCQVICYIEITAKVESQIPCCSLSECWLLCVFLKTLTDGTLEIFFVFNPEKPWNQQENNKMTGPFIWSIYKVLYWRLTVASVLNPGHSWNWVPWPTECSTTKLYSPFTTRSKNPCWLDRG